MRRGVCPCGCPDGKKGTRLGRATGGVVSMFRERGTEYCSQPQCWRARQSQVNIRPVAARSRRSMSSARIELTKRSGVPSLGPYAS